MYINLLFFFNISTDLSDLITILIKTFLINFQAFIQKIEK